MKTIKVILFCGVLAVFSGCATTSNDEANKPLYKQPWWTSWMSSPHNPNGWHPTPYKYHVTPKGIEQYPKATPSGIIYTPPK